jgi:hypothetical protein
MNGLNIPTDNLYKFIALTGMSIVLVSFYLATTRTESYLTRGYSVTGDAAVLALERNQLNKEIAESKRKKISPIEQKQFEVRRDELNRRRVLLAEKARGEQEILDWNRIVIYDVLGAGFIGIIVAVCGFSLWYHRVQKYMDRALREQKPA